MEEILMKKILSAVLACAATMAIATCAIASAPGGSDDPSTPATSEPTSSEPATSEPTVSDPSESPATSEPTTSAPKVEEVEFTATVTLGEDGKLEGAALTEQILSKDGAKCTWSQVETIKFSADGAFSLSFYADKTKFSKEIFVFGEDEIPDARDDADAKWGTEWTITEAHVDLFDPAKGENAVILEAKDAGTTITADVKVLVEVPAEQPGNTNNPGTGIALAVAPAGLAVAFVTVAAVMNKKRG